MSRMNEHARLKRAVRMAQDTYYRSLAEYDAAKRRLDTIYNVLEVTKTELRMYEQYKVLTLTES